MADPKGSNNLFKRLTRLFRSGPVVKRKVRAVDTSVALPDRTNSSAVQLFQRSMGPTYSHITANAYNMQERMARYQDFNEMEYSLIKSTLCAITDGTFVEIGELARRCEEDPNYTFSIYAYDHEQQKLIVATGKQARKTRTDHCWKVTFDNGQFIVGSANHRLMLRDGSYRMIEDLKPGDAMMPFYRRQIDGYNRIYTMDRRSSKSGWQSEHRLVAEHTLGRTLEKNEVVHHKNFIRDDNRPENLQVMLDFEHWQLHHDNVVKLNEEKWSEENKAWAENFKRAQSRFMTTTNPAARYDITFEHILNAAQKTDFNFKKTCRELRASKSLIIARLSENGFSNFSTFASAYRVHNETKSLNISKGINDLSLEIIKQEIHHSDTKAQLAMRLGCTVNVLNKYLMTRHQTSWLDLRREIGFNNESIRIGGRPKKVFDTSNPEYQAICSTYQPGMSMTTLIKKSGLTVSKVVKNIHGAGFKSFREWSENYKNHKVVSIEYHGVEDLYDLTVDGYKNFATDSVVSHNTAEINSAMDIYADETVAQDEKGRTLHIYSNNPKIKGLLQDLFYNTLNVEFNLRPWCRNLVKYGDFFLYNDVSPEHGVMNVIPIPVNEIEREEGYDKADPMAVRFRWVTLGNRVLENWEVTHMRLLGNDMFLPYGSSVLEGARRIWRQLLLIEDAMLVYRIVRSPERRVFYIDVGNVAPDEIPHYLEQAKATLRSQQVIDKNTGRVDLRYNPLSVDEDYFIPVRGSETGTKIETLQGGQNTAAVEDVQYIQRKLFAALKVPKAYLGYDEALSSKATLAQEDIRFSRTVNMIQRTIISELNKIAIIHLYANGWEGDDLLNFTLRLSNPSTVAQQQKLELYRTKFDIAAAAPEGLLSRDWLRKNVLGLTDEEIIQIERELIQDAASAQAREAAEAGGGGGGGGSGGSPGGFGGGPPGGGGEEDLGDLGGTGAPPEEGAEETPPEEPEEPPPENAGVDEDERELLVNSDDLLMDDEPIRLSMKDESAPIKAQAQLQATLYNRRRRRYHGASKTHMPDFNKMTSTNSREMNDPYDNEWLKSAATNPLGEAVEPSDDYNGIETLSPSMTNDMVEMLRGMAANWAKQSSANSNLLTEEVTNLDGLDVIIENDGDDE